MNGLRRWPRDAWLGLAILLFGIILWQVVIPAEIRIPRRGPAMMSPAFLPTLSAGLITLIGSGLLVQAFVVRGRGAASEAPRLSSAAKRRVLVTMGLAIGYYLLISRIGFFPSSALAMVLYMRYLGEQGWRTPIVATAATLLLVYLVFQHWMMVPLPRGSWFQ